jgi:orotate phosphoribosyltransferase
MEQTILDLLSTRKGHFLMESGHHGDLWLNLESLCQRPQVLEPFVDGLAAQLAPLRFDAVCGPLVEGAFVGLMVAMRIGCSFSYSQRSAKPAHDGLFPAQYGVPAALRASLRGKRVAIVNDVTNAGSAVKGTFADLEACGAQVVAIASLLVLGDAAARFAEEKNTPLVRLAHLPNNLWLQENCPLCAAGTPLEDVEAFATAFRLRRP